jgi:hypothetical protein
VIPSIPEIEEAKKRLQDYKIISDIERRNKNFDQTLRRSPDEHETETNSID